MRAAGASRKTSPIEYYMHLAHDLALLSKATGLAGWRIRRHFRPKVHARLGDRVLARYGDALGSTRRRSATSWSVLDRAPGFGHRQAAHCESGVMSALSTPRGLPMSGPMAFGLARRWHCRDSLDQDLRTAARRVWMPPGPIIPACGSARHAHASPDVLRPNQGMAALDAALHGGAWWGCNAPSSGFVLPEDMRFHFNATTYRLRP